MMQEAEAYQRIQEILARHSRRTADLQAQISGEAGRANQALEELEEAHPHITFPHTHHGDRVRVTAPVNDPANRAGDDERLASMEAQVAAFSKLQTRALRLGID